MDYFNLEFDTMTFKIQGLVGSKVEIKDLNKDEKKAYREALSLIGNRREKILAIMRTENIDKELLCHDTIFIMSVPEYPTPIQLDPIETKQGLVQMMESHAYVYNGKKPSNSDFGTVYYIPDYSYRILEVQEEINLEKA